MRKGAEGGHAKCPLGRWSTGAARICQRRSVVDSHCHALVLDGVQVLESSLAP
jgi:hypothetical protein